MRKKSLRRLLRCFHSSDNLSSDSQACVVHKLSAEFGIGSKQVVFSEDHRSVFLVAGFIGMGLVHANQSLIRSEFVRFRISPC
jgi:hypothetical protein